MNIYLPNSVKYLFRIIFGHLILLAGEVPLVTAQNTTILKNALGVVVGAPQTMAVFYERLIDRNISLQIHAGTVIVFSSAGIRLNWINNNHKFFPYLFMGSVLIHSEAEDAGDPYGTTGYLWLGTGIRYTSRRWILFGEFCAFLGGNENKGIGDDWIFPFDPAIAGGLQIRF